VKANQEFLQGGHIDDYWARANWKVGTQWSIDASVQYEHWQFPALAPTLQTNVTTSVGVVFQPGKWNLKR
jgi:hypothetical protein